jgi:putative restriction endonuclease
MNDLENYVLNEPEVKYGNIKMETEEDEFVRGGLFKKLVPMVYNATCCITGMQLQSSFGHSFIDVCHIMPFSISHNDQVNNGIALCPNLHRAFDRGLISIDTDYRVLISAHLIENADHPYGLKQLGGTEIRLPQGERYYPGRDNLEWHRGNVFKG